MTRAFATFKGGLLEIENEAQVLEQCLNKADCEDTEKAAIAEEINVKKSLQQRQHHLNVRLKELKIIKSKLKEVNIVLNKIKVYLEDKQDFELNQEIVICWINFSFLIKEIAENNQHPVKGKEDDRNSWRKFIDNHVSLYISMCQLCCEANKSEYEHVRYVVKESLKHSVKSLIEMGLNLNLLSNQEVENLNLGDINPKESKNMLVFLSSIEKWDSVYEKLAEL